ncbi:hypothetical protein ACJMQP_03915 [Rhodopseudomonas palustris]
MSKVFVVQQPAVFDSATRNFKPKFDLSPAAAFGPLRFIFHPGNIYPDRIAQATRQAEAVLCSISADDYILPVGDPVAISIALLVAGKRTGGRVNVLKYDRQSGGYSPFALRT